MSNMSFKGVTVESPFDKSLPDHCNFVFFEGKDCIQDAIAYMNEFLGNLLMWTSTEHKPPSELNSNRVRLNEHTFKEYFTVYLEWEENRIINSASLEPLDSDSMEVENLATLELLLEKD